MALRHVQRGLDDSKKDRMPLFQRMARDGSDNEWFRKGLKEVGITVSDDLWNIVATIDDDMADNWDQSAREDYLLGYETFCR